MASYRAAQVPAWVGDKLQSAIGKNLTLPSCADIPLPHLLAVDAPSVAAFLPAFLESLHAGARCSCWMRLLIARDLFIKRMFDLHGGYL